MELQRPIQDLSPADLSVLISEYIFPKKQDSEPSTIPMSFIKAIKQAFNNYVTSHPKSRSLSLNQLNKIAYELLETSPSEKLYKKEGFSTFKKALESIRYDLSIGIKIKKDQISW